MAPEAVLDRLGRPLRPFMQPELRRGKKPPNAGRRYPAEVYSPAELERLMRAAGGSRMEAMARRDQAADVLMWRGGLRIAEAVALVPADLNLGLGLVEIRRGKGNKRRVVPIDPQAVATLQAWLDAREQLDRLPPELLCNVLKPYQGLSVTTTQLRKTLQRQAELAGITRRMHPHGLRHTFAFELKREGVPEPVIQLLLGHSQLQTTLHYINHTLPGETATMMQRRRWPARVAQHVPGTLDISAAAISDTDGLGPEELRARVAELETALAARDQAIVRLTLAA